MTVVPNTLANLRKLKEQFKYWKCATSLLFHKSWWSINIFNLDVALADQEPLFITFFSKGAYKIITVSLINWNALVTLRVDRFMQEMYKQKLSSKSCHEDI